MFLNSIIIKFNFCLKRKEGVIHKLSYQKIQPKPALVNNTVDFILFELALRKIPNRRDTARVLFFSKRLRRRWAD